MKHLKTYEKFTDVHCKVLESASEINEFIDYLRHDLEDDGLAVRKSNTHDFLNYKYRNLKLGERRKERHEQSMLSKKEVLVFDLVSSLHKKKGLAFSTNLNLYDAEPHVKRLLDYAKDLGYNHFEVRKISQMSRRSQDVTQSFTGKGRLPESTKREILILQILIMK
jgi:hypothetical protein